MLTSTPALACMSIFFWYIHLSHCGKAVAGHRLGALEGGGVSRAFQCIPGDAGLSNGHPSTSPSPFSTPHCCATSPRHMAGQGTLPFPWEVVPTEPPDCPCFTALCRAVLKRKKKCSKMAILQKKSRVAYMFNHGWWLLAVGGSWWLVIGGCWWLAAVGGW